jgi:hypothetical protein
MAAAEQQGYIADHSCARLVRHPVRTPHWPLPDFGNRHAAPSLARHGHAVRQQHRMDTAAHAASTGRDPAASPELDTASSACLSVASTAMGLAVVRQSSSRNKAEIGPEGDVLVGGSQTGMADWREAIVEKEREEWQPNSPADSQRAVEVEAYSAEIGG